MCKNNKSRFSAIRDYNISVKVAKEKEIIYSGYAIETSLALLPMREAPYNMNKQFFSIEISKPTRAPNINILFLAHYNAALVFSRSSLGLLCPSVILSPNFHVS